MIARITPGMAAAIGALVIAAMPLAWSGLDALAQSRGRLAMLEMQAKAGAAPSRPLLDTGLGHDDAERAAAMRVLVATVRRLAAERRLLVERIDPLAMDNAGPAELALAVSLSGPEADILRAARAIEAARPATRFADWRVARTGRSETAVRLEGRLVGYWEPGR